MKEKRLQDKPACVVKSAPVPMEVKCPHCGMEIEIWSDETELKCAMCGFIVYNHEGMTH
jgi:ribosomal protein S27E